MLKAYIAELLELAQNDDKIIHLLADSGEGYDTLFKHSYPDRMFNFGIAEQNMIGTAAGLALSGKIPFVFAQGAFLCYRAMEFLRDDICLQNANVKIAGNGSGLALSSLGPSHHTTEDISVLRALPNLEILSPASPAQVKQCMIKAYENIGPSYIRLGMSDTDDILGSDYQITDDGFDIFNKEQTKSDILIVSTGSILRNAVKAKKMLESKGIGVKLANVWRLKPFNENLFLSLIDSCRICITVEEHNIYGGLGSIAAEVIAKNGCGKKLVTLGLNDCFAVGYGTYDEVREQNGLSAEQIAEKAEEANNNE